MDQVETLHRLEKAGLIAVVRGASARDAVEVAQALAEGGLRGIEITFTTPDADRALAELEGELGSDVLLGAGTVTTDAQARAAANAGARFLVSPGSDTEIVARMIETRLAVIPGVLTPSEVMAVLRLGLTTMKLFPGSLGGPAYLKALRAPFPDVRFVPTGGVSLANLDEWFDAGAVAVGAGGRLAPARIENAAHREQVVAIARQFMDALARRSAARDATGVR
jgi:2-dehydro-3-deoxyphosphogluconate aldolase/(4S)-4-hydroxy-2-oxoglutarate aldolase